MKAMDFFGEAMYAYHIGDKGAKFTIIMGDGTKYQDPVSWYFRIPDQFDMIEKALFENDYGYCLENKYI